MIQVGSRVYHNTLPPFYGKVTSIQLMLNAEPRLSVLRDDTNTLVWDTYSAWDELSLNQNTTNFLNNDFMGDEGVIDVDFVEIN